MNIDYFLAKENEKPLDNRVYGGGLAKIFRTVGCIGDSLASGEFQSYSEDYGSGYHDMFEYSWGQYMARDAGFKVYNFSRGGMTAKEYLESYAALKGFWGPDKLCQAYIIALGVNDVFGRGYEIGKAADCEERSGESIAYYYGKIIKKLKQNQPKAKFFLMTMPRTEDEEANKKKEAHAKLLYEFKEKFDNTYIIDLYKYAPVYDEQFRKLFYLDGHLNPAGYILTSDMVLSYLDYIIRHNMEDFCQVPFIGKNYYNTKYKW